MRDGAAPQGNLLADAGHHPARSVHDGDHAVLLRRGVLWRPEGQVVAQAALIKDPGAAVIVPEHQLARRLRLALDPAVEDRLFVEQEERPRRSFDFLQGEQVGIALQVRADAIAHDPVGTGAGSGQLLADTVCQAGRRATPAPHVHLLAGAGHHLPLPVEYLNLVALGGQPKLRRPDRQLTPVAVHRFDAEAAIDQHQPADQQGLHHHPVALDRPLPRKGHARDVRRGADVDLARATPPGDHQLHMVGQADAGPVQLPLEPSLVGHENGHPVLHDIDGRGHVDAQLVDVAHGRLVGQCELL